MIQIRRHLHEYPELSFQEKKTSEYILNYYQNKKIDIQKNINGSTGIVVTINKGKSEKAIALRADFDALPIQEETGLSFCSKNPGVMHGCGHDGHTAYMMVLADCLIELQDEIPVTIKIIHQHAEELAPGGAIDFLQAGIFFDVDQAYAMHCLPVEQTGKILYRAGNFLSGRARFELTVLGRGGHGSSPQSANDPIVAASYFVTQIQTIISRRLNPFDMGVITIGSFDGKGPGNVILDKVSLIGEIRYMKQESGELIFSEIGKFVRGLEETFGVKCNYEIIPDFPVLHTNEELTAEVISYLQENMEGTAITGLVNYPLLPASDDFAWVLKDIPGTYLFFAAPPKNVTNPVFNHNPAFDFDEEGLLVAAQTVGLVVCRYAKIH